MKKRLIATVVVMLMMAAASFAGTVSVSSPTNGSTVGSPVHFVASASSSYPVASMRIYIDGVSKYLVYANRLDTSIAVAAGTHSVVVQAWDQTGATFRNTLSINVGTTTPSPTPTPTPTPAPSGAKVFSNIDQMPYWDQCDKCSGINANGPTTPHTMTQNIANPSLDGKSAQFWLGGSTPYASAIWWKQLGANSAVKHFVYDLYFYIKDAKAPNALEFDTNQSISPYRYVFGTECSLKTSGQWSVWNGGTKHWVPTGVPCNYVAPYTWHHLTEESERTAYGQVRVISITLDGKKYYINKYLPAQWGGANDINVAIQLDGNSTMTNYTLWADKITLTYW